MDGVWETAPMLFWIIKHNTQTEARLVEYDDFTVLIAPCVYIAFFSLSPTPPPGWYQVNPPSKCGNLGVHYRDHLWLCRWPCVLKWATVRPVVYTVRDNGDYGCLISWFRLQKIGRGIYTALIFGSSSPLFYQQEGIIRCPGFDWDICPITEGDWEVFTDQQTTYLLFTKLNEAVKA